MDKKVYVLIYHDNLNAYSAVYATKKVAEQALQQEREILLNVYSGVCVEGRRGFPDGRS